MHRAELHDGSVVAVKVQYPEIDRVIATDLANFAFFIRVLARIEPRFDLRIVLKEIEELIPLELDFENEARNARKFAALFAGDAAVRFPTPVEPLTRRTVLTMSFMDGVKISDVAELDRQGIDKHAVADLLTRCYLRQILEYGFFHGDPHPGNLLVQPGPVLVILDLVLAKEFTRASRDGVLHLAAAVVAQDPQTIGRAFRELGFETKTGSDAAYLFPVSVRDNLLYGLRHYPIRDATYEGAARKEQEFQRREAARTDSTQLDFNADWTDYAAAGATGPEDMEQRIVEVLKTVDLEETIFDLGLRSAVDPAEVPGLADNALRARAAMRERLAAPGMQGLVELFDADKYNRNATLAENRLFGTPIGKKIFDIENLTHSPYVRRVLDETGLAADFTVPESIISKILSIKAAYLKR